MQISGKGSARVVATSSPDLFLVRLGDHSSETPDDQLAGPLLLKVAKALSKPGIRREAVFGTAPKKNFYAYSLDPSDPSRMIREDASGNRTVGRMVDGRFRRVTTH